MTNRVLITGATGGVGQALVEAYQGPHNDLALHYRSDEALALVLAGQAIKAGSRAAAFGFDFAEAADDEHFAHFLAKVHNEIGAPNIAILNAADQSVVAWDELKAADWDSMYRSTFRASAILLGQIGQTMRQLPNENRVVILVGSVEGLRPAASHAPYATMKAALHHLVLAAAHELGQFGIRVVGVAPGLIDREGLDGDWPEGYERWNRVAALGRPVTAQEVAHTIEFLTSEAASGITGVVLPVDAGWSAHPGW